MRSLTTDAAALARGYLGRISRDVRLTARVGLGLLLLLNLVAAAAVFRPWGGSQEELQAQRVRLAADLQQRQTAVARLRSVVENVEKTSAQADQFFRQYFLDRKTAFSAVLDEVNTLAEQAHIRPAGDNSFNLEPIEGSDDFGLMTITCNYQGSYADLIQFVSEIDHSPHFITIDRLQASPTQAQGVLAIQLRLNVFVRGEVEDQ
jgi:Tfp pilus assembly protein PilO